MHDNFYPGTLVHNVRLTRPILYTSGGNLMGRPEIVDRDVINFVVAVIKYKIKSDALYVITPTSIGWCSSRHHVVDHATII